MVELNCFSDPSPVNIPFALTRHFATRMSLRPPPKKFWGSLSSSQQKTKLRESLNLQGGSEFLKTRLG